MGLSLLLVIVGLVAVALGLGSGPWWRALAAAAADWERLAGEVLERKFGGGRPGRQQ